MYNDRAWITENEAECLARYSSDAKGETVEIGTFQGGGAKIIREHLSDGYPLWTIDIFGQYPGSVSCESVREYLKDYSNLFMVIGNSQELGSIWNRKINLLIVDGSHHEQKVRNDVKQFGSWVVENGIMIMHDAANCDKQFPVMFDRRRICSGSTPGVAIVLKEVKQSVYWELVEIVDTMAVLKKLSTEGIDNE